MSSLLHWNHGRLRHAIALHAILFMAQHPGQEFIVSSDYTRGEVAFQVTARDTFAAVHELEAELPTQRLEMELFFCRGRSIMELEYVQPFTQEA